MIDATYDILAYAYPPLIVFAAALLVLVLPRLLGFAVGTLSLASVVAISLLAPEGAHLTRTFLGFQDIHPFLIDDFTRMMGIALGFLGTFAVIYAYSSEASRKLAAIALAYVASALGAAFAGDWLVLVFMWEIMALTSTLLVWQYGGDAVRAGYRYALAHGIGGSLVLFAVIAQYAAVGSFAMVTEAGETVGFADGIPLLLAVLGIGVNVAFVGFHTWLPDTYPRPHFAASVFLAAFTTKTSAYVLYRAIPEGNLLLAYMGGAMAVYGVVFALLQHDMRALLSYHIQAQLGYMVAGIGIGSAIGIAGAMGHLFNNVLYKSLLFMAVGVVIYRTGENDLYKLGGLWREMPLTAIAFAIGALSITAVPGFSGFISKGMVLDAADPAYYGGSEYQALYWLLFIGAIGTFLSFIKLGYYVFLHGPSDYTVKDSRTGQTVAMFSVGGACVLLGLPAIGWPVFADLLPLVDGISIPDMAINELEPYSDTHLQDALILIVISVIGFKLIRKPLSKMDYSDPSLVVNPTGYYLGRGTMLAITDLYAAVDNAVVSGVKRCYWAGNNPVLAVDETARRLPMVDVPERQHADGGRPSTIHLRAGIGTTVLLLTIILTVIIWLLV
ncbi:Mrp-type sodium/proton antiporter system subunit D2 [Natrialba magadii ATCC 43099]|uniref:Monovalent cation/H+ antiporter subunit D n=1 Tax=Natrialba magadii (strain ATCC 43099 / DSM 3394 / CCM 3739 / CIP 104546 / IAM 13178 / JCM 8861 / NBRC 102185 / NCIMB 2190 / MS3) TaxID=547559 RepID=D3STC8_NATMM|nr:Na(+)/H(+) antiporter subunit D [Natrialba magadii]ADD06995.1 Mrp-type sodium/proton antiporter system subunit D2 [Natrialba magadii ATCC 43099]ELY28862.1 monovalent cation/H+ antiporter subunit D [Natrialba magadii ATCC 43099]